MVNGGNIKKNVMEKKGRGQQAWFLKTNDNKFILGLLKEKK